MIDLSEVMAGSIRWRATPWTPDDVILYHLGIGAGVPPTAPTELELTYERGLKVLPSFAVVPAMPVAGEVLDLPGFDVDQSLMLHGEQEVRVLRPIPAAAPRARTAGRVAAVHDKGSAAVAVLETTTADDEGPIFTNRYSMFLRGEGGFGGDPGPPSAFQLPRRSPDLITQVPTLPQQALLYRLSGDRNPLHVDPTAAAAAGFDAPILHGLCTFGIVVRAVAREVLGAELDALGYLRTRFSGVVVPGQTLDLAVWRSGTIVDVAATIGPTPVLQARLADRTSGQA